MMDLIPVVHLDFLLTFPRRNGGAEILSANNGWLKDESFEWDDP
jgi:hypothetical protein